MSVHRLMTKEDPDPGRRMLDDAFDMQERATVFRLAGDEAMGRYGNERLRRALRLATEAVENLIRDADRSGTPADVEHVLVIAEVIEARAVRCRLSRDAAILQHGDDLLGLALRLLDAAIAISVAGTCWARATERAEAGGIWR